MRRSAERSAFSQAYESAIRLGNPQVERTKDAEVVFVDLLSSPQRDEIQQLFTIVDCLIELACVT